MSNDKITAQERLSRNQAAERLIDIAYTLTAGQPLALSAGGRQMTVALAGELRLTRKLKSTGGHAVLELTLTWSAPAA